MRKHNQEKRFKLTVEWYTRYNAFINELAEMVNIALRTRTLEAAFHTWQSHVPKVCPHTHSHLSIFVLYLQVGVMTKGRSKTNRGTHCGRSTPKIKEPIGLWLPKSEPPWVAHQHGAHRTTWVTPDRSTPGVQATHSSQEDYLLRTECPLFLTPLTAFVFNSILC